MQQLSFHIAEDKCSPSGDPREPTPDSRLLGAAQLIKLAGFSLVARALENEIPNGSVSWNLRLIHIQSWKVPWRASGSAPHFFIFFS